jgi:hypothetical protein
VGIITEKLMNCASKHVLELKKPGFQYPRPDQHCLRHLGIFIVISSIEDLAEPVDIP